jgi:Zn-dependent M16 (insulinase) family peptidase
MGLGLISYLLFETKESPMYEELIESGFGEIFTDMYGLKADKLVTFSFGVKGRDIENT